MGTDVDQFDSLVVNNLVNNADILGNRERSVFFHFSSKLMINKYGVTWIYGKQLDSFDDTIIKI